MKKIFLATALAFFAISAIGQEKTETLKIFWPEQYKWKVGSSQNDGSVHLLELIPENETVENWTIMGAVLTVKGVRNVPMDVAMNTMFEQAKSNAPDARISLIEKNETDKHHWVIFKIEAPRFNTDENPESQLYYIVQGDSSLYSSFVALRTAILPDDFVTSWTRVFKQSRVAYQ